MGIVYSQRGISKFLQVRHLLQALEVEKPRDTDSPPMSAEDRDMLWSSIGELQRVNQKLMSDLHTAKANHAEKVKEANIAESVLKFFESKVTLSVSVDAFILRTFFSCQ